MNSKDYQEQAARTLLVDPPFQIGGPDLMVLWNAIGLAGEAGEIAELVKKGILHQHGLDQAKIFKELGDACWYIAGLCTTLGIDLGDVMEANISKLKERYPDGFTTSDSIARVDVKET